MQFEYALKRFGNGFCIEIAFHLSAIQLHLPDKKGVWSNTNIRFKAKTKALTKSK